ncbi:MAG: hypothetical protein ACKO40_12300 [Planctomycetaceae bacterium]
MDLKLQRPQTQCAATGRAFAAGDLVCSALVRRNGTIERVDVAADAWSGAPADVIAWWRCRHPAAQGAGREPTPADALLDALEALEESPDEPLRYLLALQLVRRRVLRMPDARENHDDPDVLVLACRRRGRDYRVRVAAADEGVEERLASLLWSGEAA